MAQPARVVAVLGPTNTGKTHYAIERMLGHRTGVIGLPLRLLAREVYDRIVALRGSSAVALVTGDVQTHTEAMWTQPLQRAFGPQGDQRSLEPDQRHEIVVRHGGADQTSHQPCRQRRDRQRQPAGL